jgi:uncharacterized membrane protein YqjE
MNADSQSPGEGGLVGSLRRLCATLLQVVQTRLELVSTDMAEARLDWVRIALVVLGIVSCLQAGLLLAVLFVVLVVGQGHQLAAIGISALVLLLGVVSGVLWLRWWLKHRPPLFASTIAEFRKDRDRLRGGS